MSEEDVKPTIKKSKTAMVKIACVEYTQVNPNTNIKYGHSPVEIPKTILNKKDSWESIQVKAGVLKVF